MDIVIRMTNNSNISTLQAFLAAMDVVGYGFCIQHGCVGGEGVGEGSVYTVYCLLIVRHFYLLQRV